MYVITFKVYDVGHWIYGVSFKVKSIMCKFKNEEQTIWDTF
jgi:hypothetical protein